MTQPIPMEGLLELSRLINRALTEMESPWYVHSINPAWKSTHGVRSPEGRVITIMNIQDGTMFNVAIFTDQWSG